MLDKTYQPGSIEGPTYRIWEEAGAFAAGRPDRAGARPYAIVIPPPNAVTVTFAAFDWLMSLHPHWYSTIFGLYFFSGAWWASWPC